LRSRPLTVSGLGRDTKLLIAVSGILGLGFYGITMLLRVLFVLRLGYGPQFVGLFNAVGSLGFMAMSLPGGALGSRIGVRRTMLIGAATTVMGMALMPVAEFLPDHVQGPWLITSRVSASMGYSVLSVNLVPLLIAVTRAEDRNKACSINSAARGMGAFVGSIFGGMLPGLFANAIGQTLGDPGPYRWGLWVGAFISLAAIIPVGLGHHVDPVASRKRSGPYGAILSLPIALMVAHVYVGHAGWAMCQAFGSAYMDTELDLRASLIGLIVSGGQCAAILAALLTPRLARRLGNGWILTATTLGMAVSMVPLGLVRHWAAVVVAQLGVVALSAIWMPTLQVFQMELVEPQWRSMVYGAVSMAISLSFTSVNLGGGYLIGAAGYRSLFLLGALLSAAGGVLMLGIQQGIVRREAR
jgi:MFS family permease